MAATAVCQTVHVSRDSCRCRPSEMLRRWVRIDVSQHRCTAWVSAMPMHRGILSRMLELGALPSGQRLMLFYGVGGALFCGRFCISDSLGKLWLSCPSRGATFFYFHAFKVFQDCVLICLLYPRSGLLPAWPFSMYKCCYSTRRNFAGSDTIDGLL